tara:strand:- start:1746 stop:2654 length:909 start_codon:yes stop_codon:yes gene_type:complete
MNFFITGSSGFIGQNLIYKLKSLGHKIVGIDINDPQYVFPDEFIKGSFYDSKYLSYIDKVDCVIHLAADGGVPKSVKDPIGTLNTNVVAFVQLLEKIKNLKNNSRIRIIYASSGGTVVGESKSVISEDSIPKPKSPFGISKFCTEMFSNYYEKNYNLDLVGLRFTNVYGPMMDKKPNFISKLMLASINNNKLNIFGDGNQSRDFIYIDDVIRSIIFAIESKFRGVLQIGTGTNISINQVLEKFSNVSSARLPQINYEGQQSGDVLHVKCLCKKAFEEIGFKSQTNFDLGLEKTYFWFKNIYQ